MEKLISEFMAQETFAVAGSFRTKEKFAYQIFESLLKKGKRVYPINPQTKALEGVKCYRSITELPEKVDVVNLVTPPKATEDIVRQCLEKGITRVWMQPGAESAYSIDFCKRNNIKVIFSACMILGR
ncbi:MAG: CoA-binding protein [Endomicrobiales bacterium]|nr:CoA-binding protein [Endomicrobiales bacterium]